MSDEQTDAELLQGLAGGRAEAWAELYDRFGRRLFAVAYRMLQSQHDAEEVVQEVFMSLYRARRSMEGVRDLGAYVFSAVGRTALRHARRRDRRRTAPLAAAEADPLPADPVSVDRSADLEAAVAALPDEQREVIALKIDGELTFAQIGAVLQISPNTAASRYRYALEKLRAALLREE